MIARDAGAGRALTFRVRFGLAVLAFAETMEESLARSPPKGSEAWHQVRAALREARASWRSTR